MQRRWHHRGAEDLQPRETHNIKLATRQSARLRSSAACLQFNLAVGNFEVSRSSPGGRALR